MKLFITLAFLAVVCHGEYIPEIKGMQLLSLSCKTSEQLSFVHSFDSNPDINFLKLTRDLNESIDVLVAAQQLEIFKNALALENIHYQVIAEDVSKVVAEEKIENEVARLRGSLRRTISKTSLKAFKHYPTFDEIEVYLKNLTTLYTKTATLLEIGKSYEGRPIYVVKISSGGENKPAIWIDAGIHAREWIAPSTALYALHQLVTVESNSKLYDNVDWYILPSMNPDGYEYTHSTYRFWRKTRSVTENSNCRGVDGNRNFGYKWMTVGASSNPCSDIYAGSKPFSEIETQVVKDFILAHKDAIKVYLTFHSYGQYMLHPWGWTSNLPESEEVLRTVAEKAAKALYEKYGTQYVIGSSTNVLYAAAGGSDDWALGVAGADLSYTIELPGGRFDPPASRITPVGIETFEAIKVFSNYVEEQYAIPRGQ